MVVFGIILIGLVLSLSGCIGPTYTVTYAPGTHGTFLPQVHSNLSHGDRTPTPPIPTGQPGYVFTGWSPVVRSTVTENVTYTAQWRRAPPAAEITSRNFRDSTGIGTYTVFIDASVHNFGGNGTVIVWATVYQGNNQWTRSQTLHMNSRDSTNVTFTFREPSFWGGSMRYRVWVENVW